MPASTVRRRRVADVGGRQRKTIDVGRKTRTKLSNVFRCCSHHRYLHDYGFSATMREGEIVFLDPAGHEIPPVMDRSPLPDGAFEHCARRSSGNGAGKSPRIR